MAEALRMSLDARHFPSAIPEARGALTSFHVGLTAKKDQLMRFS